MKIQTMDEMAKNVAERALDEIEYNGKTLREWVKIILATDNNVGTTDVPDTNVGDMISRQDAIKDAESWAAIDERERHLQENVIEWLKEFPTAELGTNLAEVGTDCISRQQAIDAVMECYDNDELFEVYEWKLNELPPIQPESYGVRIASTGFLMIGCLARCGEARIWQIIPKMR